MQFSSFGLGLIGQSSNYIPNPIELHFATDGGSASLQESGIASVVRRCRNDLELWMQNATGPNDLITLTVIQIIIHNQQVVVAHCQSFPSSDQIRYDLDGMRRQKLLAYLRSKNRMIFNV
jgi:hypothetical protein